MTKAVNICAPRNIAEWYDEWLTLSDAQAALFRRLEKRARAIRKTVRDQILRPCGATVYCAYCGEVTATQIDHIVPIMHLGDSRLANLAPACIDCNMRKGAKRRFTPPVYSNTEMAYAPQMSGVIQPDRNIASTSVWHPHGYRLPDPQRFRLLNDY